MTTITTLWIIATVILALFCLLMVVLIFIDRQYWNDQDKTFVDQYDKEESEWYQNQRP